MNGGRVSRSAQLGTWRWQVARGEGGRGRGYEEKRGEEKEGRTVVRGVVNRERRGSQLCGG